MSAFPGWAKGLCLSALFVICAVSDVRAARCERAPEQDDKRFLMTDIARSAAGLVTVGESGIVKLLDPAAQSICAVDVPTRLFLTSIDFPAPETGWIVGYGGIVLHTRDGGVTWQVQVSPSQSTESQPFFSVRFVDSEHGVAVGAYGTMMVTRDGGANWERSEIKGEDGQAETRHIYALVRDGSDGLIAIGESGEPGDDLQIAQPALLYRSDDGGGSWVAVNSPYHGTLFGGLSLGQGRLLVFGLRGHVFASDDAGKTWREIKTGTTASFFGALKADGDTAFVFGSEGTMLRYRWGSDSAQRVETGDGVAGEDYLAGLYAPEQGSTTVVGNGGVQVFKGDTLGLRKAVSGP